MGPKQITYKFGSMQDIADWFKDKATALRSTEAGTQRDERFNAGQAFAWEQAAEIVANAEVEQ